MRTWAIFEQFVLGKQERWRSLTCNESQVSEQLHILPTFQNGRDAFNNGSSPRTQLFDKNRSKRYLFWHTSRQKLKKICWFSMGRKFIQIPLVLLWPRSRPFDFQKTSEDPNCLIKENQCKNNNIFGRHPSNGPNVERNFPRKGDIDFSVTKCGFVINLKKSKLTPVKEIESLGLVLNSVNMKLALPNEKVLDIQNKCMQLIVSPKTIIVELTKLLGKLSFTAQEVLPGRSQCR